MDHAPFPCRPAQNLAGITHLPSFEIGTGLCQRPYSMSLGLSVGLASTALQLYARIVNSDKNFYDLDKALKCFCEALKLNEDHLDRLPPTKEACEELVTDIQKSIFEYESANALQRPFVALQDIESLKSRMTQLASYLTASSK